MNSLSAVLETAVYCTDLSAARKFYREVLGLQEYSFVEGQFVFFRVGEGMFLVFDPEVSSVKNPERRPDMAPQHGAQGAGHMAFRVEHDELDGWRQHLLHTGVEIEADFEWPSGGRSIYFRDPGNNSIELATRDIWP